MGEEGDNFLERPASRPIPSFLPARAGVSSSAFHTSPYSVQRTPSPAAIPFLGPFSRRVCEHAHPQSSAASLLLCPVPGGPTSCSSTTRRSYIPTVRLRVFYGLLRSVFSTRSTACTSLLFHARPGPPLHLDRLRPRCHHYFRAGGTRETSQAARFETTGNNSAPCARLLALLKRPALTIPAPCPSSSGATTDIGLLLGTSSGGTTFGVLSLGRHILGNDLRR